MNILLLIEQLQTFAQANPTFDVAVPDWEYGGTNTIDWVGEFTEFVRLTHSN